MLADDFVISKKLTNPEAYNIKKINAIKKHISMIDNHFSKDGINESFALRVKFPLGKTGKDELISLFSQIEGKNIFNDTDIDINEIDGLLQKRHLIVHQDISPGLTEGDILKYQNYLKNVAKFIDNFITKYMNKLRSDGS